MLRSDALGPEGEGHRVASVRVSLDTGADLPSLVEFETDALLEYARSTKSEDRPLSADPIRARLLVEAYIASRVARLLRMRSDGQGRSRGFGSRAGLACGVAGRLPSCPIRWARSSDRPRCCRPTIPARLSAAGSSGSDAESSRSVTRVHQETRTAKLWHRILGWASRRFRT